MGNRLLPGRYLVGPPWDEPCCRCHYLERTPLEIELTFTNVLSPEGSSCLDYYTGSYILQAAPHVSYNCYWELIDPVPGSGICDYRLYLDKSCEAINPTWRLEMRSDVPTPCFFGGSNYVWAEQEVADGWPFVFEEPIYLPHLIAGAGCFGASSQVVLTPIYEI